MSRVPAHRSLIVRLLGTSILIVVLAVGAAAWLAAKTATRAVRQEHGQTLAGDFRIHDTLLGHAATHPGWSGVEPVLRDLAAGTGRRITLTTGDGTLIAASHPGTPLPDRPDAVLDPIGDPIDPRAVGPYRLSEKERAAQRALAENRLACLRAQGIGATLERRPSGRSEVRMTVGKVRAQRDCRFREEVPTRTERAALDQLHQRVNGCLKALHLVEIQFYDADFTWYFRDPTSIANSRDVQNCVDWGRREQLRPFVAAPARLYLSSPARPPVSPFDLSPGSTARIAGVTVFVLCTAIAATLLVGMRLIRPLRTLTAAADGSTDRPVPVAITGNDEIGRLAGAFNDLAARSEHSERLRRTMVDDIAHELRSPLTNIRNWLTAGQDGLADLDQDLLRLLLEEAGLLQHIVDDLSDLADADNGTLTLNRAGHAVGDLLAQVCDAHRRPGVPVTLTVDGDPVAGVDPVRFRQIIGNLLTNALRHTPDGGRVDVRAGVTGGDLVVTVTDTGEGIAAADLSHVFDRFWRADRARARATGGSGLGLSIARRLAQAHDGDVTVTSEPGVGSTFAVRISGARARPGGARRTSPGRCADDRR
ncbi:HAMP domain-containing sensor histidine kinase [Actinoplanes derwentensis]|uniref:histidine kinase n=1 Tax=Actinoplanes derwentensis TaxID=113562 RepID=A0A1H1RIR4_9ACTN|nr:HAMP domain-containing sensor histidine kinase [Actinoplanes derwentensis]GID84436.1 two-component sensor histidine kinase [Actinoplanes derwentensis]SDS35621.1 two-component system, OmpR family, sensor histidine kinase BaeS [Actinoplanes derwentensis]